MANLKLALPPPAQDAVRQPGRDPVAGARDRRERGDLLAVRPDAPARRCRCSAPDRLVNLAAPGPEAGEPVVQPGRRLRRGVQLSDVPRPRDGADGLHRHRRRTSAFGANLAYRGQTSNGEGMLVSGSYFPVLGLQPALGRLLGPTTIGRSAATSSRCSATRYWATRLGGEPGGAQPDRSSSTASR